MWCSRREIESCTVERKFRPLGQVLIAARRTGISWAGWWPSYPLKRVGAQTTLTNTDIDEYILNDQPPDCGGMGGQNDKSVRNAVRIFSHCDLSYSRAA